MSVFTEINVNDAVACSEIVLGCRQGNHIGEYDKDGKLIREYIYLNNIPVGMFTQEKSGELLQIHTDHLGTPRAVTDKTKAVQWRWEGDQFGDVQPQVKTITLPIRHAGQYADDETGLFYNYHRYYDPSMGRYNRVDPLGLYDGTNSYIYVGGNPLRFYDSLGLFKMCHRNLLLPIPVARHCYVKFSDGTTSSYDPKGVNPDPDPNQEGTICTKPQDPEKDDCIKKKMQQCKGNKYDFFKFNCCHCIEEAMKECRTSIPRNSWPNNPINPGPQNNEPGYSNTPTYNNSLGK